MSFILDALKKSESDRQRQTGPALFEVKVTPPKSRFPLWAVAIAVLLGVNAVIGGWLLLHHSSRAEDATSASAATPQPEAAAPAAPAPASAAPAVAPTAAVSGPQTASAGGGAAVAPSTPPSEAPARTSADPVAAGNGPAIGAGGRGEPTLAGSGKEAQTAPQGPPGANPDDYAPAAEPAPSQGLGGHVKVGTSSGYVLYQDAAVVPGANIPTLRLDLHVYAPRPEDRFALVNMHKVREGDTLPEGVRVEAIIPDGVILSHNGMKFLLPRQ